ncbi:MAG: hypothetical protein NT040_01755 [Bacteroidetes bacterium]|nr:hypothetical protein [Bacteroidota bacterium]
MKTTLFSIILMLFTNLASGQTDSKEALSIGDHYGGGIIFSIDSKGQHGLIALPSDQPIKTCWGDKGLTNATLMNEGASNTEKIVAFVKKSRWPGCEVPVACLCDTLTSGGYQDWYLPAINELKEMYDKQKLIGGFAAMNYCSSTESTNVKCWSIHFMPNRKIIFEGLKSELYYVRCIRKF